MRFRLMFLKVCLNPCFNGILKYIVSVKKKKTLKRLNPCFNGILKYRQQYG